MSELKTNLEQILQEKTTKLIPENIKRKIEIFDVTGTDGDAEVEELQAKIIETRQEIADTRRDLENSAATVTGTGENVTLNQTAEATFKKPPLPMGNSEQESTNNLLYLDSVTGGHNDIEPTLENGIVHLKGTNNEEYNVKGNYRNGYVKMNTTQEWKTNTAYYISCKIEVISNVKELDTSSFYCFLYGSNNQPITKDNSTGRYIGSITTPASLTDLDLSRKYIEIRIDGMEVNISEVSLKTVEDYTFDGYGIKPSPEHESPITNVTGDVEVKVQNKNLLPNNLIWQYGYVNGSGNWNGDSTHKNVFSDYIYLKAGIYTISYEIATIIISIAIYDKNKTFIERNQTIYTTTPAKNKTFTLNQDGYIRVSHYDNTGTQLLDNINSETNQLEIGSTSTDYIEHKEQTFTFPLGDEKLMLGDYLADDGIHHVRGQVELNQNNIGVVLAVSTYNSKSLATIQRVQLGMIKNYNVNTALISTYKEETNLSNIASGKFSTTADNTSIWIFDDRFTDLATARNLLLGTIIEFELAEEVIIPYTSAQQEVYNQIKQAISYEEQTNIRGSSNGSNPIFTVTAFRDADLAIASLDNRVTLLED